MVGQGINEGLESTGLNREDLFITSKLWLEDYGRANVDQAYNHSIQRLGLDYLDLYLMHWPGTNEAVMIDTGKVWKTCIRKVRLKILE